MQSRDIHVILLLLLVPNNVLPFNFLRDLIFPRIPVLNRVRRINEGRAFGEEFAVLDCVGLVEKHGYTAEEHNVVTRDGYKLKVHRIPGTPTVPQRSGKPVVLFQHGVLGSSDHWVLRGPGKDLAFLLADQGYDVWMGNIRGNTYSRAHVDLSPSDDEFWKFSWHEMAIYDLPAMIDYILDVSRERKIYYIGHSMGTTIAYALLSTKPEYNDKIRLSISLAPVAFWVVPPSVPILPVIDKNYDRIKEFLEDNKIHELFPQTTNNARFAKGFCSDGLITQQTCMSLLSTFSGQDPYQFNATILPYLFSYYPAGSSSRTALHFVQNVRAGAFQQYDHGYIENFKFYGKRRPFSYDVKKISAPFALIYGANDPLSREENVNELAKKLQNVVTMERVPYDYFNHLDFIWAQDAKELIYDRIIQLLSLY